MQPSWKVKQFKFFDGSSSAAHSLDIKILDPHLQIGKDTTWPYDELVIVEKPTSSTPAVISNKHYGDARLVIDDVETFQQIMQRLPRRTITQVLFVDGLFPIIAENKVVLAFLFAIILSFPYVSSMIANRVSDEELNILGEEVFERFVKDQACKNKTSVQELNRLLNTLTVNTDKAYEIYVAKHKMVNAFAIPKARIVIFKGLLDKMTSPNELSMVIAHEIGHIEKEHLRQLYGSQTVLGGGRNNSLYYILSLINNKYSRDNEIESDLYAYDLAIKHSIDPHHMISVLEILKSEGLGNNLEKVISYIATHPATDDRIAIMKDKIGDQQFTDKAMISQKSWEMIKGICET